MSNSTKNQARVGLTGAVLMIVGFVVGASIYVLPGQLYNLAGPVLVVSFIIAIVPAAISCVVAAKTGAAFPTDAANIAMVQRLLSPLWAALTAWCFIGASILGMALLAYGFADYMIASFPSIPASRMAISLCIVGLFTLANFFGVKIATKIQTLMVLILIVALLMFVGTSTPHISLDNFSPIAPHGLDGMLQAIVPAFFAFLGFALIVEISGEIKSPEKNVPRALAISFLVITFLYLSVVVTVIGIVPGEVLSATNSAIALASDMVQPGLISSFIKFSALLAAATSINALILFSSRDVAAFLSIIKHHTLTLGALPNQTRKTAVLVVGMAAGGCILAGSSMTAYAITTVVGFLVAQVIICVAASKLPRFLGTQYRDLNFHVPRQLFVLICWLLIFFCTGLIGLSLLGSAMPAIISFVFLGIGFTVYRLSIHFSKSES